MHMMYPNVSHTSPNQLALDSDSCPAYTHYATCYPQWYHWPHWLSSQESKTEDALMKLGCEAVGSSVFIVRPSGLDSEGNHLRGKKATVED